MAKGGWREGAGRPTAAAVAARRQAPEAEEFVEGARALLPEALETVGELARGIWVEWCSRCRQGTADCQCEEMAKVRLYKRAPDRQANEILVEYGHGRAAQVPQTQTDTKIELICNVPRPAGKGK